MNDSLPHFITQQGETLILHHSTIHLLVHILFFITITAFVSWQFYKKGLFIRSGRIIIPLVIIILTGISTSYIYKLVSSRPLLMITKNDLTKPSTLFSPAITVPWNQITTIHINHYGRGSSDLTIDSSFPLSKTIRIDNEILPCSLKELRAELLKLFQKFQLTAYQEFLKQEMKRALAENQSPDSLEKFQKKK